MGDVQMTIGDVYVHGNGGVHNYYVGQEINGEIIDRIVCMDIHINGDPFEHIVGFSKSGRNLFSVNRLCPMDINYKIKLDGGGFDWRKADEQGQQLQLNITDFGKKPSEIPDTPKRIELASSEWDALITKHIEKMFGGLEMASVEYFMQTGKVNGSFRLRLISLCLFYKWAIDDKEYTYGKK